jgi:Reverse transcriptase (RNA-dependent DNA polymerase)
VDRRAYKAACRSTHQLITTSLSGHVCSEVRRSAHNPKLLWKTVTRLLHPGTATSWYQNLDSAQLAKDLCGFFIDKVRNVKSTVSSRLHDSLNTSTFARPPLKLSSIMDSFTPITPAHVEKLIMSAPNKTSPLDIFPIALLKSCRTILSVPIAHMVNQSFANGIFRAPYKSGLVTLLLKKAGLDTSDLKNFRPITNLRTISKIIEWLALFQLKPQITGSPNYCHHQSAYRSAHSTETALLKIVNNVVNRIDEGSVVALVGLDISAAFDTVNHEYC